jgi:hypothetical protein
VKGENFNVTIGRVAWEACCATWNLGTNSAFALGPRKTMENLDRVGQLQDLPDANWLLASSPALTLVPSTTRNVYEASGPRDPTIQQYVYSCGILGYRKSL